MSKEPLYPHITKSKKVRTCVVCGRPLHNEGIFCYVCHSSKMTVENIKYWKEKARKEYG
jgi:hypothetical protein